jgi:hypothetical protein
LGHWATVEVILGSSPKEANAALLWEMILIGGMDEEVAQRILDQEGNLEHPEETANDCHDGKALWRRGIFNSALLEDFPFTSLNLAV